MTRGLIIVSVSLVGTFTQHHTARVAFYVRGDLAVLGAEEQIALPVGGHGPTLNCRRSLTDGYHIPDLTLPVPFLAGMP